jgi:hypothetical protein
LLEQCVTTWQFFRIKKIAQIVIQKQKKTWPGFGENDGIVFSWLFFQLSLYSV